MKPIIAEMIALPEPGSMYASAGKGVITATSKTGILVFSIVAQLNFLFGE